MPDMNDRLAGGSRDKILVPRRKPLVHPETLSPPIRGTPCSRSLIRSSIGSQVCNVTIILNSNERRGKLR
jgi:hypothetical protein